MENGRETMANEFVFMKYLLFLIMGIPLLLAAQTPCENGYAGIYPCNNVDLLSHVSPSVYGGGSTNEVWGWTDPQDASEYALLGASTGTIFFDITDPVHPLYVGKMLTATVNSSWRTLRVYDHYLFVGSEASNHGLQVFDLHRLRNVVNPPQVFAENAHYSGFGRCHSLTIEEETGYLFACGTNTFSGGLHIVNIQDPLHPVLAGAYSLDGYTHEAQAMVYNGPDPDYTGHIIVFCYNGNNPANLTIVDATDPTDATTISITFYPNSAYCHQGWSILYTSWVPLILRITFILLALPLSLIPPANAIASTTLTFWFVRDTTVPVLPTP